MRLAVGVRVLLGVLFICVGGVKIPRIGKAISPDTNQQMAKDFGRFLRVAPFKNYIKITSSQYRQFVGYTELFCGFLLVSGQLVGLASTILAMMMVGATYTHYRAKDPVQMMIFPSVLFVLLLFISFTHRRKEKQD